MFIRGEKPNKTINALHFCTFFSFHPSSMLLGFTSKVFNDTIVAKILNFFP